jgi:hypothetical protein
LLATVGALFDFDVMRDERLAAAIALDVALDSPDALRAASRTGFDYERCHADFRRVGLRFSDAMNASMVCDAS